jgi:hypothetical protein
VNDPDYNMKEVIKQSVLLEQHLSDPRKACRSCIAKHFLTIVALCEEALGLAGERAAQFPLLSDSAEVYSRIMNRWLAVKESRNETWLSVHDELRVRRRRLIDIYILKVGHLERGGGDQM